jgi:hypothetical protein
MLFSLRNALFLQATGSCPSHIDEVIRGWDRYVDQVKLLPQEEKDKVEQIAGIITNSFITPGCTPLGQIIIIGHADKDFHGAAFEQQKSEERATSVAAALATAIIESFKKHNIGHIAHGAIAFLPSPTGVGASQPDPGGARDRALNRRVEIHVRRRGAPVPLPDTLERRVRRALKILETKGFKVDSTGKRKTRAQCLLNKMLRSDVVEVFVDGTKRGEVKIGDQLVPSSSTTAGYEGRYDGAPTADNPGPPLPDPEFMKLLGTVSPLLMSSSWDPSQSDDQILEFLDVVVLEKIYTGILRVERYLTLQVNGFTGRYEGDRARIRCNSLYSNHFDDDNNIYNCWKGYTGGEDSRII